MNLITVISFGFFLIIFLWVGAIAAKFTQDTDSDYLLANRSFGKYLIGLSAGATTNSGSIMTGMVGFGYSTGISTLLITLGYFLGDLTFWTFFPDKINNISLEQDSLTVPELLGAAVKKPQGKKFVTSIVALISVIFVGTYTTAQFYASAKILNAFFGIDLKLGAILAAVLILVYCVKGGLRASVWTDAVQAIVGMFVAFGVLATAIIAAGSIPEIAAKLNSIDPQLTNIFSGFTWWAIIAYVVGFAVAAMGFGLSQPQFLVRLMAGRNPQEADADIWSWAITASWKDVGKLGSQLSFVFGMPPKVTNNDVIERKDEDTSLHFELSYRYPLNDRIFITPGFLVITNPDHNADNDTTWIGLMRTST